MKKRIAVQRWICAILTALLLVACAPAALATSYSAKINSSACKVYKSASTSSKVLCSDVKDLRVSITGYSGDWAKVSYKGNTGYVKCEYLTLSSRLPAYTAKSTPVYKRAASSSSKLGTLGTGSTVYVVGMDDGYYRIQNRSGSVTGYVKSGCLTATKPKTARTPPRPTPPRVPPAPPQAWTRPSRWRRTCSASPMPSAITRPAASTAPPSWSTVWRRPAIP